MDDRNQEMMKMITHQVATMFNPITQNITTISLRWFSIITKLFQITRQYDKSKINLQQNRRK